MKFTANGVCGIYITQTPCLAAGNVRLISYVDLRQRLLGTSQPQVVTPGLTSIGGHWQSADVVLAGVSCANRTTRVSVQVIEKTLVMLNSDVVEGQT